MHEWHDECDNWWPLHHIISWQWHRKNVTWATYQTEKDTCSVLYSPGESILHVLGVSTADTPGDLLHLRGVVATAALHHPTSLCHASLMMDQTVCHANLMDHSVYHANQMDHCVYHASLKMAQTQRNDSDKLVDGSCLCSCTVELSLCQTWSCICSCFGLLVVDLDRQDVDSLDDNKHLIRNLW